MTAKVAEEDRQWASNVLMHQFHDEFCEYDATEDGVDVCAAECRDFAEALTGIAPELQATS